MEKDQEWDRMDLTGQVDTRLLRYRLYGGSDSYRTIDFLFVS